MINVLLFLVTLQDCNLYLGLRLRAKSIRSAFPVSFSVLFLPSRENQLKSPHSSVYASSEVLFFNGGFNFNDKFLYAIIQDNLEFLSKIWVQGPNIIKCSSMANKHLFKIYIEISYLINIFCPLLQNLKRCLTFVIKKEVQRVYGSFIKGVME